MNVLKKLWTKHLLLTNTISCSLLLSAGDYLEQHIISKTDTQSHNWSRTKTVASAGLVMGPFMHTFYRIIDKTYPSRNVKTVLKKVFIDQIILAPTFITSFFVCTGIAGRQTIEEITKEIKEKFLSVLLVDCMVWLPSQFINFLYVQPKYRVLYVNTISLLYNTFLAHVKFKENNEDLLTNK